jgi:hypothetical protein
MTTFTSHGGFVLYGKENTYGTAVAAAATVPFPRSSEWSISNQLIEIESIGRAEPADHVPGFADVRGRFEGWMTAYEHNWFKYALGRGATDTISPNVTKFTTQCAATNMASSFTFYTGIDEMGGESKVQIAGCKVDSLSLTARAGEAVTYTVNFFGKEPTLSTTATKPSWPEGPEPLIFANGYVMASIGSSPAVATIANIEEITFTVNNNQEQMPSINRTDGRLVHEIAQNQRRITGEMTVRFDPDYNNYQQWAMGGGGDNTPQDILATVAIKLDFESKALVPSAGATYQSFMASLPKCKIGEGGYSIGTNEILSYRLPFAAFYDDSNTALKCVFENDKDAYD